MDFEHLRVPSTVLNNLGFVWQLLFEKSFKSIENMCKGGFRTSTGAFYCAHIVFFLLLLLVLLLTPLGPTLEPTWRFLGLQSPRLQHLKSEMPWRKGGRAAVVPPWGSQSAARPAGAWSRRVELNFQVQTMPAYIYMLKLFGQGFCTSL